MATSVIRWSLGNRAVVILLTLVVMAGGVVATLSLNQELFPDISFPDVFIITVDPGASPSAVDRDVSKPIADALSGLPKLAHITTTSNESVSTVSLEFDVGSTIRDDQDQVSQALGRVTLPPGLMSPSVQTFGFNSVASMTYSLAATDGNLARVTQDAEQLVIPALKGATGAAQVKLVGGAEKHIVVTLDPVKLATHGLALSPVTQALSANQIELPAGEVLDSGKTVPVEVSGALASVDEIRALVVSSSAAGPSATPARGAPGSTSPSTASPSTIGASPPVVHLSDVATVDNADVPISGIARTDGVPSLSIDILKTSEGNAVTLSNGVRARVAALKLDGRDRLNLIADTADGVKSSLNGLLEEGLIGAVLAVLIIFLFLRSVRATLVTAVSLPTSVLVALLGTKLLGYSLNIMTLAGLTIAIGRVVDDAIVVLENSFSQLQRGLAPRQAALEGASQVASPVLSTSLTTVAVFLPIAFIGGIVGQFFKPFAITVAISLLASLVVSLTIVPVLISLFLGRVRSDHVYSEPLPLLLHPYRHLLSWSLTRRRNKAIALGGVVIMMLLAGVSLLRVPVTFFPSQGSTTLRGTITFPPGTSTAGSVDLAQKFETQARADPAVKLVQVSVSGTGTADFRGVGSSSTVNLTVLLKDKKNSDAATSRLAGLLESDYGKANAQLTSQQNGPPSGGFTVNLVGTNPDALRAASTSVVDELQGDTDLTNVRSALSIEQPQVSIKVDTTRAAQHHVSPQVVAFGVSQILTEQSAGALADGTKITVRVDPATVTSVALDQLQLVPGTRLVDVSTVSRTSAPQTVTRLDGAQEVSVTADFTGKDTSGASRKEAARLSKLSLPNGVTLTTGGVSDQIASSFSGLFYAMGAAMALVFIILVVFFRSVVTPFVILLSVPLSLIGATIALGITGQPLGIAALMGVLMVSGIVVSNAVLLVHFAEEARSMMSMREALIAAGSARLRPILMTAIATVVALIPLAIGLSGSGGLISQSLAVVVEGGLISSTVLTLVVIPVVYSIVRKRALVSDSS
ncbi:MAG: efflux RND transporter permease subunit [Candidatus Dormibacteria bacterium]